jgi:hypothetical protein
VRGGSKQAAKCWRRSDAVRTVDGEVQQSKTEEWGFTELKGIGFDGYAVEIEGGR